MVEVRVSLFIPLLTLALSAPSAYAQTTTPEEPTEPSQPHVEQPPQQPQQQPTHPPEHPAAHTAPASSSDTHDTNGDDVVVRAKADDWGMFFRFGGLSTLVASNNTRTISSLLVTQVGLKAVLSDRLMIPFFFGTGVRHISEDTGNDSNTDFGMDLGVGVEYHFRTWHRISPFVGGSLGLGISDPEGEGNTVIGLGVGPNLGVEYYVADRLSLTAQYMLVLQFENGQPPGSTAKLTTIQFSTLSGGAMNLTFYF